MCTVDGGVCTMDNTTDEHLAALHTLFYRLPHPYVTKVVPLARMLVSFTDIITPHTLFYLLHHQYVT